MKFKITFLRPHTLSAGCWILLILSLLSVYIGFAERTLPLSRFYSSDTLYLPDLYRDLQSGYSLWGASFIPGRPYFFPDMLLFFVLNFLTGNFHLAIALNGLIQCLLFVAALLLLSNKMFKEKQNSSVYALILLLSSVFFFLFSTRHILAFFPMFVAGHHFSVVLALLFLSLLGMGIFRNEGHLFKTICYACGLLLCSSAMLISDSIFLIQCLLPMICGFFLCYLFSLCSARQFLISLLSLTPALLLTAWLTPKFLIFWPPSSREPAKIEPEHIFHHAKEALQQILLWSQNESLFAKPVFTVFSILWGLFVILASVLVLRLLVRSYKGVYAGDLLFRGALVLCFILHVVTSVMLAPPKTDIHWIVWGTLGLTVILLLLTIRRKALFSSKLEAQTRNVLFFFFTLFSSIAVNLASAMLAGTAVPRYFLPALLLPIVFGWPLLLAGSTRFITMLEWKYSLVILMLAVLGFAWFIGALQPLKNIHVLPRLQNYSTAFSLCLDEQVEKFGLRNGLAEYWIAKPAAMLSRHDLNVVPVRLVDVHVRIEHWQSNLNRYAHDFDFIISWIWPGNAERSIPRWVIKGLFGEPLAEVACEDKHILVYTRETDFRFRKQFREHFERHLTASEQAFQTGELINSTSRIAREGEHQAGFLVFGPYTELFIGEHEFTFRIEARQSPGNPSVGTLELLFQETGSKTLTTLESREITKEGKQELSGTFTLRNAGKIELRIQYNGTGALRVDTLDIKRVR